MGSSEPYWGLISFFRTESHPDSFAQATRDLGRSYGFFPEHWPRRRIRFLQAAGREPGCDKSGVHVKSQRIQVSASVQM